MLTIDPNSACDVCAEEYGPLNLPRCIPCGHVLCESCCMTICEKTPQKHHPACPFCRENFTPETIRVIRVDCGGSSSSSGASTPRALFPIKLEEPDDETIIWDRRRDEEQDRPLPFDTDVARLRAEARQLEDRVARVAAKKCSVEEVHTLHRELQEWLVSEAKNKLDGNHHVSLRLSAALLRAILMNHFAHSEAIRIAKGVETSLRQRVADEDVARQRLESDNKKIKSQLSQKTQECQQLKNDISRLKSSSLGLVTPPSTTGSLSPSRRQSVASSVLSGTSEREREPSLSRGHPQMPHSPPAHARSASHSFMSSSVRPSTPSSNAYRSLSTRSMTPGPGHSRSMTPAPPPLPRSMTPAPLPFMPRGPPIPPKPRTLTGSSPPSGHHFHRGVVDDREHRDHDKDKEREKSRLHELWIPPSDNHTRR